MAEFWFPFRVREEDLEALSKLFAPQLWVDFAVGAGWARSQDLCALHLVFLFALVFTKLPKTSLGAMEDLSWVWQEHSGSL